jgi:alkanesulfonate monooxygenase SsuD/methylene tetrahydromethanopterin reductase-like flavin-dependent oxidoreductase (luciferase family)
VQTGLFLPIFGELADPRVTARLAAEAEAAGFDGIFVWDHVQYRPVDLPVADPWVTLAAVAGATERVRIGPMVTPLPRRRTHVVARQAVSVDLLAGGRLSFGVGIGADTAGELSAFGEPLATDDRARGDALDEALEVLVELWRGEPVMHKGPHVTAEGVTFRPVSPQSPRVPIWVAARWSNRRPLRRAARFEGLFPIALSSPDQLAEMVGVVAEHRLTPTPFDVVVRGAPGEDHGPWADCGADPGPWEAAGATWWLVGFDPATMTEAGVRRVIQAGPPR